jgi:hypothetical protein
MTSKGHIYMIFTPLDNSFSYIGSTFNRIHKRFQGHKAQFNSWVKDKNNKKIKKCAIFKYFEKYGIENFKIILIKSYNVVRINQKDHKHLHAYELLWINRSKNCVNELLPFNPLKKLEYKEQKKKYYKENKNKLAEQQKEYSEKNKEKIAEYQKKHYKNNKQKIAEQQKNYKENNKEAISAKSKIKYTCVCNSIITIHNKSKHEKTKKHIQFCEKK